MRVERTLSCEHARPVLVKILESAGAPPRMGVWARAEADWASIWASHQLPEVKAPVVVY